jgi:hypothetical protein
MQVIAAPVSNSQLTRGHINSRTIFVSPIKRRHYFIISLFFECYNGDGTETQYQLRNDKGTRGA